MTDVARIPADINRDDRLLAGLTGRQLFVLAGGVGALAAIFNVLHGVLPGPVLAAVLAPVGTAAAVLAFGRLDGLPGDRAASLWLRHLRRPRRLVPTSSGGLAHNPLVTARGVAALELPIEAVADDGVLDLGPAGSALVCQSSSLNFGLRTDEEQRALVAAMSSWLNSLVSPAQILVRAERVDVGRLVDALDRDAPSLPHPDLEQASRDHARFLAGLASRHDVLRREVRVVFRDHRRPDPAVAAMLHRRAEEAAAALGAAGLAVTPLDRDAAMATLARAANPDDPTGPAVLDWADDAVVRGGDA